MSRLKGHKAVPLSTATAASLAGNTDTSAVSNIGLNDNSFKNLKDKISAQLKSASTKEARSHKTLKHNTVKNDKPSRGKKRTADGDVVSSQRQINIGDANKAPLRDGASSEEDALRQALKELGGTEEDLSLINGADSESELEGIEGELSSRQERKKGSTLQEGMANILKEIAMAQGDIEDQSEESDDEELVHNEALQEASVVEDKSSTKQTPSSKSSDKPAKQKAGDSRFKFQPRADWFKVSPSAAALDANPKYTLSQQSLDELLTYSKDLLTVENETFKNLQQSSSSQAFYNTVIASGTLSDKISALTLAVQESPVHNVKALEVLIGLAKKRNRAQAIDVLRALKDLLAQGSLLPGDRRLYAFTNQPALLPAFGHVKSWKQGDKLPQQIQESDLICWAYEDWLKQQYFEILKILEVWCNDEIDFAKSRAVSYVFELLKEKPEQESNLLRLLVNKLGDPVKKIASQTSHLIMELLSAHPAMKMTVISAIEADFIFRPGQSMHGKYYAAVTINQTVLSMREEEVAKKLLDIYFGLFTSLLKPHKEDEEDVDAVKSQSRAQRQRKKKANVTDNAQSEELREKLVSAVLTGVNRAYPYVGTDQKNFANHLETLFKITHSANFNTSVQAMLLIQQLTATHSSTSDRFYRTLYESLLDPRLVTASKQQLYLNLLHRSLKADVNSRRAKAFVKRLLQILTLHDAPFICGVFFLLKDLEATYPSLTSLVDQAEDHEDDEENFRDVVEDASTAHTVSGDSKATHIGYDAHKRAPEHANADKSCAWEILPFLAHFHPSVTVTADNYLQHTKLPGRPDLTLHTLIHFLDRFVYRNPKLAANKLRGSSIMQPMASDDTHAVLISGTSRQSLPAVNTDEFRNKKDVDVAAEDVFFHKYFATLGKDSKTKKQKAHDIDEDGSVGDAGEDAIWKAMIDSAPDLEGEGSEDEDLDMSDFEDEMGEDDDSRSHDEMDLDIEEDDSDSEVDLEAGIFNDSDDEASEAGVALIDPDKIDASEFEGLDSEDEQEDAQSKKRKEKRKAEKDRRQKMKALPTFASAADYAKMLEDEEDEDLG